MDTKETCIPNIKVFQDWPLLVEFKQLCSNYEPFVARSAYDLPAQRHQILAFLNSTSELTDISCAEGEGAFPGNPSSREKVDMKASDFASAWSCEKEGKPHWALTTGLNLYLSQLCLSEGNSAFNKGHEMLQCAIPSVLVQSEASLDRTNLWMNIFPAVSTLHYDANNNLLIVLEGIKHVTLFSPSCTKYLQPEAAHADYPNHSRLSPLEAETLTSSIFERRESGCTTWRVAVGEGDALFIPEGWWHQVRSEKCTMALNFWFHSGMHELLQQPPTAGTDMSSYLLRAAMHRAVDAQRSADAQRIASAVSAGEARGGSPLTVTQQCFDDFTLQLLSHSPPGTESETGRDRARGAHGEEDPWLAFVSCDLASMRARWIPFGQKVRHFFAGCAHCVAELKHFIYLCRFFFCAVSSGVDAGAAVAEPGGCGPSPDQLGRYRWRRRRRRRRRRDNSARRSSEVASIPRIKCSC